MKKLLALPLALLLCIGIAACGSDDGETKKPSETTPAAATPALAPDATPDDTSGEAPADDEVTDLLASYGFAGLEFPEGATVFSNPEYLAAHADYAAHVITIRRVGEDFDLFDFFEYAGEVGLNNGLELYDRSWPDKPLEKGSMDWFLTGVVYEYNGQQYCIKIEQPSGSFNDPTISRGDVMMTFSLSDIELGVGQ